MFTIGRVKTVSFVLISTVLIRLSRPGKTLLTIAIGHNPLGIFFSCTRTKSPTRTSRWGFNHFWRKCKVVRYSRTHLVQKWFERIWACFHFLLPITESSLKSPMGTTTAGLCSKNWAGVMAVASAASSLDLVWGREFSIDSTSQKLSLHFSTLYQPHGSSCQSPFVFLSGFQVGRWIVAKH